MFKFGMWANDCHQTIHKKNKLIKDHITCVKSSDPYHIFRMAEFPDFSKKLAILGSLGKQPCSGPGQDHETI